ncbi:MAG: DUF4037 domain-containing protein [Clostridia bacterium]|nr:DUF4037 domain-containing protein [Clostridia bacterium]
MNGLELARAFYTQYGEAKLREQYPHLADKIAVGLCGSGSECFGFDDDVSRDHAFEPGFCLFLPDESVIDRRDAFQLERAYAKLPKAFGGLERSLVQPVGGSRHGVLRTAEFFSEKAGTADGVLTIEQWFRTPEYALAEAVNGEIFCDPYGEVTAIRQRLSDMPRDVRLKKLAGHLLLMAQSGQYNYARCLAHGEKAAAQLAANAFVQSAMAVVFLLNGRYMPFYKWSFRAMRSLPELSELADTMECLLTTDNDEPMDSVKQELIEDTASAVIDVLQARALTEAVCTDLEKHAYSVNDRIEDASVRNLHILYAV